MAAASRRIMKEYADIQKASLPGFEVQPIEQDIFNWSIVIKGPPKSAYEGGSFKIRIALPNDYPFKPPVLSFETRIYHPNVSNDEKGSMCLGILRPENWKPSCKLISVLEMCMSLLVEPNIDDAVETSIAEQYKTDRAKFEKQAKAFVQQYAKGK